MTPFYLPEAEPDRMTVSMTNEQATPNRRIDMATFITTKVHLG